jgi:hypothetical protein
LQVKFWLFKSRTLEHSATNTSRSNARHIHLTEEIPQLVKVITKHSSSDVSLFHRNESRQDIRDHHIRAYRTKVAVS